MELYNSDELGKITAGFWFKISVEACIVALPLGIVLVPAGFALAYLNIGPFTYTRTIVAWLTFSGSILSFVWCLSASTEIPVESDEEAPEEDQD
jgi:hypothetical protein